MSSYAASLALAALKARQCGRDDEANELRTAVQRAMGEVESAAGQLQAEHVSAERADTFGRFVQFAQAAMEAVASGYGIGCQLGGAASIQAIERGSAAATVVPGMAALAFNDSGIGKMRAQADLRQMEREVDHLRENIDELRSESDSALERVRRLLESRA